jgi:hypothetical protein
LICFEATSCLQLPLLIHQKCAFSCCFIKKMWHGLI